MNLEYKHTEKTGFVWKSVKTLLVMMKREIF